MPTIDADGCPINVQIDGPENAPVLMLSNSLGTNLHMWDVQVPEFTKHFRLVRYDRRGHGKSGVPKGPYSMERFGRDVLAVIDALKIDRINWCGLSMGGMVGMWLGANASDRLSKMVLSNTNCHYADKTPWADRIKTIREKGLRSFAGANMERWFTKGFRERSVPEITRFTEMFVATHPDGYVACVEAIRDMDHRDLLPKIRVPTLIIAGKDDPATTVAQAEYLRDHIPGAKMAVVNAAHISNVEQPQEYAKAVTDFLLH
ncbi:MAG TPA: 3-oxoadipate enol-lactonase [Pseudolabrys sp.]|nr:3-oxoadipate enol-lactonase [Pseudolabrys sp.]